MRNEGHRLEVAMAMAVLLCVPMGVRAEVRLGGGRVAAASIEMDEAGDRAGGWQFGRATASDAVPHSVALLVSPEAMTPHATSDWTLRAVGRLEPSHWVSRLLPDRRSDGQRWLAGPAVLATEGDAAIVAWTQLRAGQWSVEAAVVEDSGAVTSGPSLPGTVLLGGVEADGLAVILVGRTVESGLVEVLRASLEREPGGRSHWVTTRVGTLRVDALVVRPSMVGASGHGESVWVAWQSGGWTLGGAPGLEDGLVLRDSVGLGNSLQLLLVDARAGELLLRTVSPIQDPPIDVFERRADFLGELSLTRRGPVGDVRGAEPQIHDLIVDGRRVVIASWRSGPTSATGASPIDEPPVDINDGPTVLSVVQLREDGLASSVETLSVEPGEGIPWPRVLAALGLDDAPSVVTPGPVDNPLEEALSTMARGLEPVLVELASTGGTLHAIVLDPTTGLLVDRVVHSSAVVSSGVDGRGAFDVALARLGGVASGMSSASGLPIPFPPIEPPGRARWPEHGAGPRDSAVSIPGNPVGAFGHAGNGPTSSGRRTILAAPVPSVDPIGALPLSDPPIEISEDVSAGDPSSGMAIAEVLDAAELTSHVLRLHGERAVVLTWWSAPHELSFVELAADGPVLPVEALTADHGSDGPRRLIQRALRLIANRH